MIKFDAIVFSFYSIVPYMLLQLLDRNSYISLLLWEIPNYLLSTFVFIHYISKISVIDNKNNINIINARYKLVSDITSKIETMFLGIIYPLLSMHPLLSHIVNSIAVAEIVYRNYNIRRRLLIYRNNLLLILLFGVPLSTLQVLIIQDRFIMNYIYNITLMVQIEWMMKYPNIYGRLCPNYLRKRM